MIMFVCASEARGCYLVSSSVTPYFIDLHVFILCVHMEVRGQVGISGLSFYHLGPGD